VGVSRDSVASHQKFKKKYELTFKLLADVDGKLCDAFGVAGLLNITTRSTFLIDAAGKVLRVWPKVKVAGHAEEVYEALP
jgi:peroxiredoxin Q/BCP